MGTCSADQRMATRCRGFRRPDEEKKKRADQIRASKPDQTMRAARGLLRGLLAILLLGDARRLAAPAAQIIELRAADLAAAHDLDRVDERRVERGHPLD